MGENLLSFLACLRTSFCTSVVVKIPSCLHQNFFHYDVDMPAISLNYAPEWGYPLKVGEIVLDAQCDIPLLEP